jgi:hypothetical protein
MILRKKGQEPMALSCLFIFLMGVYVFLFFGIAVLGRHCGCQTILAPSAHSPRIGAVRLQALFKHQSRGLRHRGVAGTL